MISALFDAPSHDPESTYASVQATVVVDNDAGPPGTTTLS